MLKVDLHVHTTASDGIATLEELIFQAKAIGLDAIAVSDHNRCTPLPETDFCLIPATEISTPEGHVLGLFVRQIDFAALQREGLPSARAAIAEIHRQGGIAVLAHPFEVPGATDEAITGLDFDLVEGANSRAPVKVKNANELALAFAEREGKPVTGGSDTHSLQELGGSYTLVDCETTAELEAAIRAGRTRGVFVRQCSWYRKGHTRLIRSLRRRDVKGSIKAMIYFGYAILRNLAEKAG